MTPFRVSLVLLALVVLAPFFAAAQVSPPTATHPLVHVQALRGLPAGELNARDGAWDVPAGAREQSEGIRDARAGAREEPEGARAARERARDAPAAADRSGDASATKQTDRAGDRERGPARADGSDQSARPWTIWSTIATTNTYVYDPGGYRDDLYLIVDGEVWVLQTGASYRTPSGILLSGEAYVTGLYGGILDPIIPAFHNLFGFRNAGRDYRPTGAVENYAGGTAPDDGAGDPQTGDDTITGMADAAGLGSVVLGGSVKLPGWRIGREDGFPARIAPRFGARISPIGRPALRSILVHGELVGSTSISLTRTAPINLAAGAGTLVILPLTEHARNLYQAPWGGHGWLQVNWRVHDRFGINFVGSGTSSALRLGHPRTDGLQIVLETGLDVHLGRQVLTIGFTEELPPYSAPDFGVFLSVRTTR